MDPPAGAKRLPPLKLPAGVYFNPTAEECVRYVNRHAAGEKMPETRHAIFHADVYGQPPGELLEQYHAANNRDAVPKWWFFSPSKLQSATSTRADRSVLNGGFWKVEQSKKEVGSSRKKNQGEDGGEEEPAGLKNSFGYYGTDRKKTEWLMEEFKGASADDGAAAGKSSVTTLCRIYRTPAATRDRKRAREEGDGKKAAARVTVPDSYFSAILEKLPPGSVRGLAQEQPLPLPPPPPPPAAVDVFGHNLGQFIEAAPHYQQRFLQASMPPPGDFGHQQRQQQFSQARMPPPGVFGHHQRQPQFLGTAPPPAPGVFGHQQQPFYGVAMPPSPGSFGNCPSSSSGPQFFERSAPPRGVFRPSRESFTELLCRDEGQVVAHDDYGVYVSLPEEQASTEAPPPPPPPSAFDYFPSESELEMPIDEFMAFINTDNNNIVPVNEEDPM